MLLVTFPVPDDLIRPHLPAGTEPDRWQGRAHVNLVALHFGDLRVRGRRVPWVRDFAQLNLRTYALLDGVPGVVFIRQLVPSAIVSAVARLRYRQPYGVLPISHMRTVRDGVVTVEYTLDRPPRGCLIAAGSERATVPAADGFAHWCKERFWSFGPVRRDRLLWFRVEHPPWAVREVLASRLELDFGAFFGPEWSPLNDHKRASVLFAVGSDVSVYGPSTDSTSSSPSP